MTERYKDNGKTIYDMFKEFYVKCPQCGGFAVVTSFPNEDGSYLFYSKRSIVCKSCNYANVYNKKPGPIGWDFPLWLEAKCCGETLWACNVEHLNIIENFVKAKLRESLKTENGYINKSMFSRFPKWMKDAKNRENIIKCIEKMKKTIPI